MAKNQEREKSSVQTASKSLLHPTNNADSGSDTNRSQLPRLCRDAPSRAIKNQRAKLDNHQSSLRRDAPDTYSLHIRVRAFTALGDETVDPRRDNGQRYRAELKHGLLPRDPLKR
jgi:hypothetical protein